MDRVMRLVVTLSLLGLAGCGPSVLDLRDDLDFHRSSFRERLAADHRLLQEFVACTTQPAHDQADPMRLSGSRAPDSVQALIRRIRERQPQGADSLLAIQDMVGDLADTPHRRITLATLHTVVDAIRRWHAHLDFDEDDLAQDSSRFGRLLLAYNKAYFGDLRFQRDPAVPASGRHAVMKMTSRGFVDRSGNVWRFPGLSSDQLSSDQPAPPLTAAVTSQRVSADLTRIFIEAFFDAAFQVPAVHGATALRVEWPSPDQSYPEFDADRPAVPLDAVARLTQDALRAEASVTAAVGKAVRGGGLFGTQNETVAAALETAAGVTAKKLFEHEGFCYFQVTQGKAAAGTPSR